MNICDVNMKVNTPYIKFRGVIQLINVTQKNISIPLHIDLLNFKELFPGI